MINLQSASLIRSQFSSAMSAMYKNEVPQYAKLYALVVKQNLQINRSFQDSKFEIEHDNALLNSERHGAIRLGSPKELSTMRRLFAVMGMHPVDYYDLSVAGIPVHSTAFRPIDSLDIKQNPFRVFTSLLRLDLIDDKTLRKKAEALLSQRHIFSSKLIELIQKSEEQDGLNEQQASEFINEALKIFRWHHKAQVDSQTYVELRNAHRLIADVVSFKGPHINHLTPRTLDIDDIHSQLKEQGLKAKTHVEGPPKRACPILLRQTSFLALEEPIVFSDGTEGTHTARFGEVEQRGVALTPKGRALYDELLNQAKSDKTEGLTYSHKLQKAFKQFPDNHKDMHKQALAFYQYDLVGVVDNLDKPFDLEEQIKKGKIEISPILYEDFLPVSAAGIFASNLDNDSTASKEIKETPNQLKFEEALGCSVIDSFNLYRGMQEKSLLTIYKELGFAKVLN